MGQGCELASDQLTKSSLPHKETARVMPWAHSAWFGWEGRGGGGGAGVGDRGDSGAERG